MSRPTRETAAGQAYLDLQNGARLEARGTQELMTLYVVERWLARLGASPYADQFVIKGGMLLAAYDARRPTADLDALARSIARSSFQRGRILTGKESTQPGGSPYCSLLEIRISAAWP
jgi:hypothetical protein